jgi:hypothetical protein
MIDVIIPAIDKDLATLPYVIDSIRTYVKHRIGRIYIVSPNSSRIRKLCRRKRCVYVNEKRVLPITKHHIRYRSKSWDRSGWLYQQLLKLSGDTISKRDFLVVDADTVFIRPHSFRAGGKRIFYCRDWTQPEYYRTYRKLMGKRPAAPRSLVTHYMLFERAKLKRLKRVIERRHGRSWHAAILRSIDRTKQFGFSEFETYGNYVYGLGRSKTVLRSARNKSLSHSPARLTGARKRRLAKVYRSVSYHKRKIYRRH